jgi:Skp family chaperone for outer membrane proteins
VVRKTTLSQQGVLNVRTSLRFATVVASLLSVLIGVSAGLAQAPARGTAPAAPNPSVVVIDINHIFRNHTRFKQSMEDMKADLQAAEATFQEKNKQIAEMAEGLKRYNPGTPEYNRLEEDVMRARADLQTQMALKKKELMLKEAGIYHRVYEEIVNEVAYFCERHGISLVLRYSSEKIDPQNANSVRAGVTRNVVYQRSVNITYDILERIRQMDPPEVGDRRGDPRSQGPRPR